MLFNELLIYYLIVYNDIFSFEENCVDCYLIFNSQNDFCNL